VEGNGSPGPAEATSGSGGEVPPPPVSEPDEQRLAESLLRFGVTQVREIMTPRPDIVAIQADATVGELRELLRNSLYSRIPVFGDNLDDIVGLVTVRDLVYYDGDPAVALRPLARPARLVPESKRISQLLKELQASGNSVAVVIDEYGGTAGLVSVEDIVEELVGEIKDEYDTEVEPIEIEADGAVLVTGRVGLDRLEEALETELTQTDEVDTVGGLVATAFGRIPRVGEKLDYHSFQIEVVEAERKRVNRVRFRPRVTESSSSES
jgi:CBS domain containing-hemolysin-like protein